MKFIKVNSHVKCILNLCDVIQSFRVASAYVALWFQLQKHVIIVGYHVDTPLINIHEGQLEHGHGAHHAKVKAISHAIHY